MIIHEPTLSIDLGEVGDRFSSAPFRVRLDGSPLQALIRATSLAHRIEELLLIERPGDVWEYVWVVVECVPSRVAAGIAHSRASALSRFHRGPHPWPEDRLPFKAFDRLFRLAGDDTEPEDSLWIAHRCGEVMRAYARQLLSVARAAQARLERGDLLQRHIVAQVRRGEHHDCFLDRDGARGAAREHGPGPDHHTPAFYRRLETLLRDPNLVSVAYRGDGDWQVLRLMAIEQRRRANGSGHAAVHALQINASANLWVRNDSWDSEIHFYLEGLGPGELHIECGRSGGMSVQGLVATGYRDPGRYILSVRDEGAIPGFGPPEHGDGCVLYTRLQPISRRVALEQARHRQPGAMGPVLSFSESGATLFDHEKALVVVGAEVSHRARATLATVIAEWQHHGGRPRLLVLGDAAPFAAAGCTGFATDGELPPGQAERDAWMGDWLDGAGWRDVEILLHAPHWVTKLMAHHRALQGGPWPVWVVSTECATAAPADHGLPAEVGQALDEACRRARRMRSEQW
ncbi:MAG: hypothetical protein L6Q68_01805 [Aquabacterium sp.]|nr:hypothetical protein [Aquabacterium sp.]